MTRTLGQTHLAAGLCSAAFALYALHAPPGDWPAGLALGAAAALAPDVDEPGSVINRWLVVTGPTLGRALRHRTLTHSLAAAAGLFFLIRGFWPQVPWPVLMAAVAGFVSHLVADSITPEGVPWLWPLLARKVSLTGWLPRPLALAFATGRPLELAVFRPLFIIGAIWFAARGLGLLPGGHLAAGLLNAPPITRP
ncbi:MAG: metal-dependent hydrolase [Bacillota bacterium]|nr:metal-dependent hydrolase [Bacillota bacterium]